MRIPAKRYLIDTVRIHLMPLLTAFHCRTAALALLSLASLFAAASAAIAGPVHIETVPVGNAGNAPHETDRGAVPYSYRIATTEVTNTQYVAFLNSVAATDTYGLYRSEMSTTTRGGILRTGDLGSYTYSVKPAAVGQGPDGSDYTYADKPVIFVDWHDTLRFVNWLHNGQPTGAQDASTTEDGAYTFYGIGNSEVGNRNADAVWFLPSINEWFKAAYYDPVSDGYFQYATGSNLKPDNNLPASDSGNSANYNDGGYTTGSFDYPYTDVGAYELSASPYGTFDQDGNAWEWTESIPSDNPTHRIMAGGSWWETSVGNSSVLPLFPSQFGDIGFRVATVPEPSSLILAAVGGMTLLGIVLRRRKSKRG